MNRVAIMQPTYLPWSGYFGLIGLVDTFIVLDHVQFAKRSWQQRNSILSSSGHRQLLTLPVFSKGLRNQQLSEVKIDLSTHAVDSHIKALKHSYGKSPFFDILGSSLIKILETSDENLCNLNIAIIKLFCSYLGLNPRFIRSSELIFAGQKSNLLVSLCKSVEATEYVTPPGSLNYITNDEPFRNVGIPLSVFSYTHPTYVQPSNTFVSHLSVVDMLFNIGSDSASLISNSSALIPFRDYHLSLPLTLNS